ncbi:MAG TPA: TfoX/Sxy family protein [Actinomycetes bacterium]|nr:TfoX/Sxy family protein [Actinomycetes bacterium]
MPVDAELQARIREYLYGTDGIAETRMTGGVGFTLHGNLLCGVMGDELLVRIGKTDFDRVMSEGVAHPMTMAGRSSRSWLLVPKDAVAEPAELARWIDRAKAFVDTLPAK